MSNDDLYRFTLVNGQVTGLQEFDDGRWKNQRIGRSESWTFDGTSLIKTKTEYGRVKTSTFGDADGDGVFTPVGRDEVTGLPSNPSGSYTDARIADDSYRFTLVNGQVTGLQEFDDGRWKNESIGRNESWTFDGTNLIKTKTEYGRVKTSTFGDTDGDGVFTPVGRDEVTGLPSNPSGSYTDARIADDSHRFTLVNGQVTGLQEFDDGRWKNESIDRNESWTFDGINLIQQEFKRYGTEVAIFSDPDGDGIFSKVSEIFNPIVAATGTNVF